MSLRPFVILVSLALPAALAAAPAPDTPAIPHEFYTLDNGLEVILHEDHSTPIVGVNVWYHVGSKNERPGRSGFAHLFEHMMFQGSEHLDNEFFGPLQQVGGNLNGSTSEDRTNYWELLPSNHLERAIQMEADRLGWLPEAMTQEKLDNQREVVRNERRESEGRPYSEFWLNVNEYFYPAGHPYDHSVIGSHEDLEAASLDDVIDFFRTYYAPNNATLSIAGDFDPAQTKAWIEQYFGEIPPGPPITEVRQWVPQMRGEMRVALEGRVQLPRVYHLWHTPPAFSDSEANLDFAASILGSGRTSRLYLRLVDEMELAQDVQVGHWGQQVSSAFFCQITLRPGTDEAEVRAILDEEFARFAKKGPTGDELERAQFEKEAGFLRALQRIGSWGGKNDRLNRYNHHLGTPDYLALDMERYARTTRESVRDAFAEWIEGRDRLVMEIVPFGDYKAGPVAQVDRTTLPEGGPEPALELPELTRARLSNGLELVVMEQHELPLVQLRLVFRTGGADDPVRTDGLRLEGLGGLAADMLMEGAGRYDRLEFAEELERIGSQMWTSTDYDYRALCVSALRRHLDRSAEMLGMVLTDAAFPQARFDKLIRNRIVNLRRQKDNARTISRMVGRRVLYGKDHPYGCLGDGTVDGMEAMTLDAVRAHASEHFTPGNAVLLAAGDITAAELAGILEEHLVDWEGAAPERVVLSTPTARTQREVYLVDKPGDSQATVTVSHIGMTRTAPDWNRLSVANRVLGGFFSSRLNLNLREDKGYTYGARSRTTARRGPGLFSMGARVQAEVTAPAITEILSELAGVCGERAIEADELSLAKQSITRGYPAKFETNSEILRGLLQQIVYELPDDHMSAYPNEIRAVSLGEANTAARDHLHPERVAVIVIGDLDIIEDDIRALGLGPVHYLDIDGAPMPRETETSTP
ncbi:MAG: pitrilysin family protein [Gemmatimonadota bacterium]|nr:pitrilysin family protein [Gemmatimonadota bacterium]